ncbi:hypothetical protein [Pantoea phytobeneficialis]|uniref:Methyltransferase FkbM domain-containing protein n=1 Tax=Pantoea phytobeneficialis TaxID=2052056 RepID=A0AAP9H7I4_9GAMM|nr:hypothetical protein [Pantoea phytobeneficialis]MDO6408876.1 hypothetical protein [Pantoea phytobeneficialis]QGR07987.1 hypothetical protein CTZ24_16780 [Pantoea phytobeneficialis]
MRDIEDFITGESRYFEPMLMRATQSTAAQREQWRTETIRERQERISLEVFEQLEGHVKYGPFTGMKLDRNTWWGKLDLASQCLGLYEKEILDIVGEINPDQYSRFIDIGAADGYYAIGMLLSGKFNKTSCFEITEKGREVIAKNWQNNGSPGELHIFGEATEKSLAALSAEERNNAFVLVDIEGFEFELLSEKTLSLLQSCTVIIEIHHWVDDFLPRYTRLLRTASQLFDLELLKPVERATLHLAELRDLTDDNRLLLTSERRPGVMRFLKLSPKSPAM